MKYKSKILIFSISILMIFFAGCSNTGNNENKITENEDTLKCDGNTKNIYSSKFNNVFCVPNEDVLYLDDEEPFIECGGIATNNVCNKKYNSVFYCVNNETPKCVERDIAKNLDDNNPFVECGGVIYNNVCKKQYGMEFTCENGVVSCS